MELLNDVIANVRLSTWVAAGALAAVSVLLLVLARWRPFRHLLAARFVRHVAAPLRALTTEDLSISESRRVSGAAAGGLIAVVAATYFVYLVGADRGGPATLFLVGSYAIGGVTGRSVAACLSIFASRSSSVRVANVRHRGVSDYLPGWARFTVRTAVALASVMLAIVAVSPSLWDLQRTVFPAVFSVAAFVTTLAVLSLVAFEFSSHLIADSPQRQDSEAGLVWDDALRSSAIRDLATSTWLLGMFGLFFGIGELALALSPGSTPGIATPAAFNIFGTAALIVTLGAMALPRTRRYTYSRLHPELIGQAPL